MAALQFEVDSLEGLDEGVQGLYQEHGGKYRLQVEGIDPADELKEALRKEREEKSGYKSKLSEFEKTQQEAETKRLEENNEHKKLYDAGKEANGVLAKELDDLKTSIATEKRTNEALKVASGLTKDETRSELLQKEAGQFIHYTPEGIKINGPDGEAWDASKLSDYLKDKYPFLVDGSQASGGGAPGGNGSGATGKKFSDYTGAELKQIRANDPAEYDRLKAQQ